MLFGSAAYRPKINESVSNLISFSDASAGVIAQGSLWPRRKDAEKDSRNLTPKPLLYLIFIHPTNDRLLLLLLVARKLIAVIDDPLFRGKVDSDHEAERRERSE